MGAKRVCAVSYINENNDSKEQTNQWIEGRVHFLVGICYIHSHTRDTDASRIARIDRTYPYISTPNIRIYRTLSIPSPFALRTAARNTTLQPSCP